MSADRLHGISDLLEAGFGAVLAPAGFASSRDRRIWVRTEAEVEHVVALLNRRGSFDVQWGLVCPDVVDVMWGAPYKAFDIGQAIVSGTPSTIQHPAQAQSFDAATLAAHTTSIVTGVREDLAVVETWTRPFRTRLDVRAYLLENRDPTDRRAFVIPAKLPLKLFTAAALAVADRDAIGCDLVREAEAALAPFKGDVTSGRLKRLRLMAADLCA